MALFADDIVLFLTNLKNITTLTSILGRFGRFSGYKVNNSKSSLLLLNGQEREVPLSFVQFTNASKRFHLYGD